MKRALALAVLPAVFHTAGFCASDLVTLPYQIGGAYSVPVTSMKSARFSAMVRQQYDYSCGSAALSTLLTFHYGQKVTEQEVFVEMFNRGDQAKIRRDGFSMLDMKRYLEGRGFQADGFEASLDKLASAGIPAIVLINENGYNHFVVVKGLRDERVLIGDPSGGVRSVSRATFGQIWANSILFVISSHQDKARFNEDAEWSRVPRAPVANAINRDGLSAIVTPKFGPSDF